MWRQTNFDDVPIKPQRVYQEMNRAFGEDVRYVSTIGLSQIQAAQLLHVFEPRHWINAGQAGPLGWTVPAALGVATADPEGTVVALSGDYDFQFMIEELAVGAQFNIPYIHVLVNNAYLGLIRQAQRGFDMDYCVQLSFDNINAPEVNGYGVDHVKVAEGLGCKAIRVFEPDEILPALEQAKKMMVEHRVPVVVEVILERVTNVSMGAEIDNITEFEELAESRRGRPDRALRQPRLMPDDPRAARPRQVQGHAHGRRGRRPPERRDLRSVRPDVEIVHGARVRRRRRAARRRGRRRLRPGAGAGRGADRRRSSDTWYARRGDERGRRDGRDLRAGPAAGRRPRHPRPPRAAGWARRSRPPSTPAADRDPARRSAAAPRPTAVPAWSRPSVPACSTRGGEQRRATAGWPWPRSRRST